MQTYKQTIMPRFVFHSNMFQFSLEPETEINSTGKMWRQQAMAGQGPAARPHTSVPPRRGWRGRPHKPVLLLTSSMGEHLTRSGSGEVGMEGGEISKVKLCPLSAEDSKVMQTKQKHEKCILNDESRRGTRSPLANC